MKNNKVATTVVSLSEGYALSEQHPLSKTIAGEENLEENLPCMHTLSAPSVCPASHLSLLVPSAPDSLSQKSLTCA